MFVSIDIFVDNNILVECLENIVSRLTKYLERLLSSRHLGLVRMKHHCQLPDHHHFIILVGFINDIGGSCSPVRSVDIISAASSHQPQLLPGIVTSSQSPHH